jgi:hypothetical protein
MEEKKAAPSQVLTFILEGSSYNIKFPTNRQYLAIQNYKSELSSHYDTLRFMGAEGAYGELLTDCIAHLTVLAPELVKDLKSNILDLSMEEGMRLTEAYSKQFRPWYNECLNFVFMAGTEPKTEE